MTSSLSGVTASLVLCTTWKSTSEPDWEMLPSGVLGNGAEWPIRPFISARITSERVKI